MMVKKTKVAAVQAEPAWLDLQGGVKKVTSLIADAAAEGVDILGFPEVFIPGYPWFIFTRSVGENKPDIKKYMANSLTLDSPEMRTILAAVKSAGIYVVLGFSERDRGSLYMAQVFIDPTGTILHHRRKLKPTHVERSIWGDGQADSLKTTVPTPFGNVSALNCWEHLQPLLRYHTYAQNTQIHIAAWPPMFHWKEGGVLSYHETQEANYVASQFFAIEGQAFVVLASQVVSVEGAKILGIDHVEQMEVPGGGFSMIFGPDGRPMVKRIPAGQEGLVCAEIDLTDIDAAKNMADPCGHYSRPDLLSLVVKGKKSECVIYKE